jgi:hypothetical protein
MSKMVVSDEATKALPAGPRLAAATTFRAGKIDKTLAYAQTGNGSQDLSAPVELYLKYTNQTGAVTLDLTALTGPAGEAVNLAGIRSITVHNLATNAAHVLTVGAAASDPFLGPLGGTAPTIDVEPGAAVPFCNKPTGAPYSTTGATDLKLDFGANSFSAELVIRGNT